MSAGQDG